jgi:hypothetical protein
VLLPSLAHSHGSRAPDAPADDAEVEVWREHGEICAYGYAAEGADWLQIPSVATFRLGREVVAHPVAAVSPGLIRGAFERSVLPLTVQLLGGEALHASAVLGPAGVVALCGESGTGKSTLASALSTRGYEIWADDAVAFEFPNGAVSAVPLPFRTQGGSAVARDRAEPLVAVLVLRRVAGELALRRLSGGDALAAALENGYCYRPCDDERRQAMLLAYLDLVARVPVLEVRFEPRWEQLELLVDTLEQVVRAP